MKPHRIQRKRTKGWRMPPNTVYVGRPTKWGNPFPVSGHGRESAALLYRAALQGRDPAELIELHGKNLACWCPVDEPCHADILLELANPELGEK